MVVTRSSVASLQAKQGLPLGAQVVGWFTLGKLIFSIFVFVISFSTILSGTIFFTVAFHLDTTLLQLPDLARLSHSRAVSMFAPDQAIETLGILEHPWSSLRKLPWIVQLLLPPFMIIYCSLMFVVGCIWQVCWRMPFRRLSLGRRPTPQPSDERWYWEAMVRSSTCGKLWLALLRNELLAPRCDESSSEKDTNHSAARRLSTSARSLSLRLASKKHNETDALHVEMA